MTPHEPRDGVECLANMLVSVKEIVESAWLFIWGPLKRSYYLVLALLADPFEFLQIVLGQRIALPSAWLPYLLGTGLLCAAIHTYHVQRMEKAAADKRYEGAVSKRLRIIFER